MGNPKSVAAPEASSLHTTRQMLDNLDALMERMLALPVNELEDAPPPLRDVVKPSTLAPSLTLLEPAPAAAVVEGNAGLAGPHIRFEPIAPLPMPALPPMTPSLPTIPEPITDRVVPMPRTPKLEPMLASIPKPPPDPSLGWLRPLWWCNEAFDRLTLSTGDSGAWLRTQTGRTILGFTGLALLIMAFVLAAKDWMGWTW